ncbi:hypothetical protein B0H21DRAFT_741393 [Amylocystis lapponica]|nr:hypothetical protein B0H21DRAFT_741393 [Amylocystis lapponica]
MSSRTTCPTCWISGESNHSSPPTRFGGTIQSGDICHTTEPFTKPLDRLLQLCTASTRTLASTFRRRTTKSRREPKDRPCLISQDIILPDGSRVQTVYLMGTLGGAELWGLPAIYRYFLISVHPNGEITHIHTMPEWTTMSGTPQWLMALPHTPDSPASGRWTNLVTHSHHRVSEEMLASLQLLSTERLDQWTARCLEEPGFYDHCKQEYLDHKSRIGLRSSSQSTFKTRGFLRRAKEASQDGDPSLHKCQSPTS